MFLAPGAVSIARNYGIWGMRRLEVKVANCDLKIGVLFGLIVTTKADTTSIGLLGRDQKLSELIEDRLNIFGI